MNVIYKWKLNKTSVSCEQGNCLELHRYMHSICQLCVEYSSLFRQIISLQVARNIDAHINMTSD